MPTTIDAQTAAKLRASEPAILEALKARADAPRRTDLIVVPGDDDAPLFAFGVHALAEADYQRLQAKHSPKQLDRETGLELPGELNTAAYRSDLIIEATEADDRKLLWNNGDLLKAYGVRTSTALVDALLPPGLKLAVCQRIDALGRYGQVLPRVQEAERVIGNLSEQAV